MLAVPIRHYNDSPTCALCNLRTPDRRLDQGAHNASGVRRRRNDLTAAQTDEPRTLSRWCDLIKVASTPELDWDHRTHSQPW